jgi:hypothetical protein
MKRDNWLKTVVAGVAIACLAIPLTVLGATKAEPMSKSQQQWALTKGNGAAQGAVTTKDQKARLKHRKTLHAQKSALMKERRDLARRGDKDGLSKNSAQLEAVDAQRNVTKKGGAKI